MGGATDAPVMACGTHNPVTISPDTAVTRCMHVMTEHRVRHLPVLNDDAVVGIISIGDVVKNQLATKDFLLDQYGQYFGGATQADQLENTFHPGSPTINTSNGGRRGAWLACAAHHFVAHDHALVSRYAAAYWR